MDRVAPTIAARRIRGMRTEKMMVCSGDAAAAGSWRSSDSKSIRWGPVTAAMATTTKKTPRRRAQTRITRSGVTALPVSIFDATERTSAGTAKRNMKRKNRVTATSLEANGVDQSSGLGRPTFPPSHHGVHDSGNTGISFPSRLRGGGITPPSICPPLWIPSH